MWRQAALHKQRRAGVAELVELDLVAPSPPLADGAEVVREGPLGQAFAGARVEEVRAVEARRYVLQGRQSRRWPGGDASPSVLRRFLARPGRRARSGSRLRPCARPGPRD